jgi:hypothetical protein
VRVGPRKFRQLWARQCFVGILQEVGHLAERGLLARRAGSEVRVDCRPRAVLWPLELLGVGNATQQLSPDISTEDLRSRVDLELGQLPRAASGRLGGRASLGPPLGGVGVAVPKSIQKCLALLNPQCLILVPVVGHGAAVGCGERARRRSLTFPTGDVM